MLRFGIFAASMSHFEQVLDQLGSEVYMAIHALRHCASCATPTIMSVGFHIGLYRPVCLYLDARRANSYRPRNAPVD